MRSIGSKIGRRLMASRAARKVRNRTSLISPSLRPIPKIDKGSNHWQNEVAIMRRSQRAAASPPLPPKQRRSPGAPKGHYTEPGVRVTAPGGKLTGRDRGFIASTYGKVKGTSAKNPTGQGTPATGMKGSSLTKMNPARRWVRSAMGKDTAPLRKQQAAEFLRGGRIRSEAKRIDSEWRGQMAGQAKEFRSHNRQVGRWKKTMQSKPPIPTTKSGKKIRIADWKAEKRGFASDRMSGSSSIKGPDGRTLKRRDLDNEFRKVGDSSRLTSRLLKDAEYRRGKAQAELKIAGAGVAAVGAAGLGATGYNHLKRKRETRLDVPRGTTATELSTRLVREIRKAVLQRGDKPLTGGIFDHLKKAKKTVASDSERTIGKIGHGAMQQSDLILHPKHGISVRKSPKDYITNPSIVTQSARKMQKAQRALRKNKVRDSGFAKVLGVKKGGFSYHEYVPGKDMMKGKAKSWKKLDDINDNSPDYRKAMKARSATHRLLHGPVALNPKHRATVAQVRSTGSGVSDLRRANAIMTPKGKKFVDYEINRRRGHSPIMYARTGPNKPYVHFRKRNDEKIRKKMADLEFSEFAANELSAAGFGMGELFELQEADALAKLLLAAG